MADREALIKPECIKCTDGDPRSALLGLLSEPNFEGSFRDIFLAGTQSLGPFFICFVLEISPLVWPFLSSAAA